MSLSVTLPALTLTAQSDPLPCSVCGSRRHTYLFVIRGLPIVRCPGCGLVSLHPQPSPGDLATFYATVSRADPRLTWKDSLTERESAEHALRELQSAGLNSGRLLIVAPPGHVFASIAEEAGYRIGQQVTVTDLETVELESDYDSVVVLYQLEKSHDPSSVLEALHAVLKPDGVLLLTVPSIDSWPARFFGSQWTEWRPENNFYFGWNTVQSLLLKHGFDQVWITPDRRSYSLEHVADRAHAFPSTGLTRLISAASTVMPGPLKRWRVALDSSGVIVTARRVERRARPLLSIVLPAYNERATFATIMDALLAKHVEGMDKEILVVESNSKDGTRELAQDYADNPEVRLILEERPRGKGHAVRTGFEHARGDIIVIQDADLEYDLNDYEALLEPLRSYQSAFVLGARHGGSWKMRQFNDQPSLSTMLNFGHVFFTTLMNVLYGQRMQDPFTMYKVFRRDCLYGLSFECNRFDFDHELVIKLIRKGYVPLELPVNYRSRSFKEGKKVTLVGDPLSWIKVNFKLRFQKILHRPQAS